MFRTEKLSGTKRILNWGESVQMFQDGGRHASLVVGEGRAWGSGGGGPLGGRVEVLGLGQAGELVLVARQAAEEHGAADAQQGGAPAEAVRPRVVVVALEDLLVELDRVDDQGDHLQHHCTDTFDIYSDAAQRFASHASDRKRGPSP